MKPKACVIDLDNCLALIGDRDPMHGHLCHTDTICAATALVIEGAYATETAIILLTGRNETARAETERWLRTWLRFIPHDHLIMRSPDDWRPAAEYKTAMLEEKILPRYDVILALDDDPTVVRSFRDRGIVCWQVREPLPVTTGAGQE